MLSLPLRMTSLVCLFLFRIAGDSWLAAALLGLALCTAGACLYLLRSRSRQFRARMQQLEEQVKYSTRKAEEAHHTKDLFLTNMSHEIRTPMNGLLGMASLLAQTPLSKEQFHYVETIRSCGDTLMMVINNILDFSAIETGKIILDEKITDLRALVKEVLEIFMNRTAKAGIQLDYIIEADVPVRVITDKGRLRQILINLVGNAVKFTQQGEIRIRVFSTGQTVPSGDMDQIGIGFEVSDTGIGMDAEQVNRIHQSFSPSDPSGAPSNGSSSLGLTISNRLAHLLHGRIQVESEPGKGSSFRFTILAKPAPPKAAPVAADALPRLAEKYPLRILLAEDNPINRQLAVLILDKMGYAASTAENGKEVLDHMQREPFDLIFMDIQMPEMDGLEATRHIRAGRGRQPVIIAMTANTTRKDREDCLNEGMNDFLSKPVHLEELIRMMETWGHSINQARALSGV